MASRLVSLLLVCLLSVVFAQNQIYEQVLIAGPTFANVVGYTNGAAPNALFNGEKVSLAADSLTGDIYVPDVDNAVIRIIRKTEQDVMTFAGTGQLGTTDGPRLTARFYAPVGVALDSINRILYVADGHSGLRKIDLITGLVSTITAYKATNHVQDVAFNPVTGTLYVQRAHDLMGYSTQLGASSTSPGMSAFTAPSISAGCFDTSYTGIFTATNFDYTTSMTFYYCYSDIGVIDAAGNAHPLPFHTIAGGTLGIHAAAASGLNNTIYIVSDASLYAMTVASDSTVQITYVGGGQNATGPYSYTPSLFTLGSSMFKVFSAVYEPAAGGLILSYRGASYVAINRVTSNCDTKHSRYIYAQKLRNHFIDQSTASNYQLNYPYGGMHENVIVFTPTDANDALVFTCDRCINTTRQESITFDINGGPTGYQNITVELVLDTRGLHQAHTEIVGFSAPVASLLRKDNIYPGIWERATIPFSMLTPGHYTSIRFINELTGAQPTLYLDNIHIHSKCNAAPV